MSKERERGESKRERDFYGKNKQTDRGFPFRCILPLIFLQKYRHLSLKVLVVFFNMKQILWEFLHF